MTTVLEAQKKLVQRLVSAAQSYAIDYHEIHQDFNTAYSIAQNKHRDNVASIMEDYSREIANG